MTRVRVEPRPFDQGRRKNDAFTHSATLPFLRQPIVIKLVTYLITILIILCVIASIAKFSILSDTRTDT